jgi:rhodanese-related sulfurtransferase
VAKIKNSMATRKLEELIKRVFETSQASDEDLQKLLELRENKKFDFKLVDIREVYEYTDRSIDGTDLLYSTTLFHKYIDELNEIKDEYIVLYCRTGSRTGQVLGILKRMGYGKAAHLSMGIMSYSAKTSKNAKLPKNI